MDSTLNYTKLEITLKINSSVFEDAGNPALNALKDVLKPSQNFQSGYFHLDNLKTRLVFCHKNLNFYFWCQIKILKLNEK